MSAVSKPPGGSSRLSFFLFLMIAPAGILFLFLIMLVVQYKQFKSMVSPAPVVSEFAWSDSSRARLDSVLSNVRAFALRDTPGGNSDSLWLSAGDLNLLLAFSPVNASRSMRFQISIDDSLVVAQSTQPVQALQGRMARLFKKAAPSGYLNARLEGWPELSGGELELAPVKGFLNGKKIPRIALEKREGLSPSDFMVNHEVYNALLRVLVEVKAVRGRILLVRK
jgi:hypothetical protein